VYGSGNSFVPKHVWKLVLFEVRRPFQELLAEIGRTVRVLCVCVCVWCVCVGVWCVCVCVVCVCVCCMSESEIFVPPVIIFPSRTLNIELKTDAPEVTCCLDFLLRSINTERCL